VIIIKPMHYITSVHGQPISRMNCAVKMQEYNTSSLLRVIESVILRPCAAVVEVLKKKSRDVLLDVLHGRLIEEFQISRPYYEFLEFTTPI